MCGGMGLISSVVRNVEGGRKTNKSLKSAVLGGTQDTLHRYCCKYGVPLHGFATLQAVPESILFKCQPSVLRRIAPPPKLGSRDPTCSGGIETVDTT